MRAVRESVLLDFEILQESCNLRRWLSLNEVFLRRNLFMLDGLGFFQVEIVKELS